MGIIDIDHSLPGQHGAQDNAPTPVNGSAGRRSYTYLFPELANHESAGLFPGTSPEETLQRLKSFEVAYRSCDFPTQRMKLPAAYTYFGQFINHDISAPVGGLLLEAATIPPSHIINSQDPPGLDKLIRAPDTGPILQRIKNEQDRPMMLDSLYAEGPASSNPEVCGLFEADGLRFRIAKTVRLSVHALAAITKQPESVIHRDNAPDIPRDGVNRKALIADRRNDENLLISQIHLALMLLHNKAVAALNDVEPDHVRRFQRARQLVTLHYQWLILNDYLPHLLSAGVLEKVMAQPARLKKADEVPMEFTTAAFRFGHSMVSQTYDFNENFGNRGRVRNFASLHDLFVFTSRSGMGDPTGATAQLPDHWVADWERLTSLTSAELSGADRIDMSFAQDMLNHLTHMGNLTHASIFFRNLVRGFHRRISFGQDLARAYGLEPMTAAQVLAAVPSSSDGSDAAQRAISQHGLDKHTPAWLYFLCEAKALEEGQRLGPTASHIVADTIVGLLKRNAHSVINADGGGWHPRASELKAAGDRPLDSIRALLLFATAP